MWHHQPHFLALEELGGGGGKRVSLAIPLEDKTGPTPTISDLLCRRWLLRMGEGGYRTMLPRTDPGPFWTINGIWRVQYGAQSKPRQVMKLIRMEQRSGSAALSARPKVMLPTALCTEVPCG